MNSTINTHQKNINKRKTEYTKNIRHIYESIRSESGNHSRFIIYQKIYSSFEYNEKEINIERIRHIYILHRTTFLKAIHERNQHQFRT